MREETPMGYVTREGRNERRDTFASGEGGLRNLEQIQEGDGARVKLGGLVLASLGTACVVFAAVALFRRPTPPQPRPADPLDQLVGKAAPGSSAARRDVGAGDVTFPSILSDDAHKTTALAAIPQGSASPAPFVLPPGAPTVPPPAADRLPVVPLPAQDVIGASPVVTQPHDPLTELAKERSTIPAGQLADEGRPGAFVLQVASFRTSGEAESFATILRQRGHHAYVEQAVIPSRGTWHRVRIGPFKYARDATKYRGEFEAKEHLVPFVIESEKERKLVAEREADARKRELRRRH